MRDPPRVALRNAGRRRQRALSREVIPDIPVLQIRRPDRDRENRQHDQHEPSEFGEDGRRPIAHRRMIETESESWQRIGHRRVADQWRSLLNPVPRAGRDETENLWAVIITLPIRVGRVPRAAVSELGWLSPVHS